MSTNSSSTFPVVLSTIVSNLQGASGLSGVQVLYGDTGRAERRNVILTGRVTWESEDWAAIGARSREERYALDGFVQVREPGDTQQQALEAAMFDLAATVESTLRSMAFSGDGSFGFAAALAAQFGAGAAQVINLQFVPKAGIVFAFQNEGLGFQLDFEIRVWARI